MTSNPKTKKIIKTEVEALESKLRNKKSQLENLVRKLARTQYEIQKLQRSIKSTTVSLKKIRETMEIERNGEATVLYESGEGFEVDSQEQLRDSCIGSLRRALQTLRDIDFLTMFFKVEEP